MERERWCREVVCSQQCVHSKFILKIYLNQQELHFRMISQGFKSYSKGISGQYLSTYPCIQSTHKIIYTHNHNEMHFIGAMHVTFMHTSYQVLSWEHTQHLLIKIILQLIFRNLIQVLKSYQPSICTGGQAPISGTNGYRLFAI